MDANRPRGEFPGVEYDPDSQLADAMRVKSAAHLVNAIVISAGLALPWGPDMA